jgi:hypothetical protein
MFPPDTPRSARRCGPVVSAASHTTRPATNSTTMTASKAQPARGRPTAWPNAIGSEAGSTAIISRARKFVSGVGFS